jgi:D-arabinose 1-dehydrogenase-like Zn-dependent alcohol dehydrogenase
VYFDCFAAPTGSFAEEISVEKKDARPLERGTDPEAMAIIVNPAMHLWTALGYLKLHAGLKPGEKLTAAMLDATGVSKLTAVQICEALSTSEIVAIGRPGP